MTRKDAQLGFLSGCSLTLSSPCPSASKRLVASQSNLHFSLQNNDIANAGMSFYDAGMCGRFARISPIVSKHCALGTERKMSCALLLEDLLHLRANLFTEAQKISRDLLHLIIKQRRIRHPTWIIQASMRCRYEIFQPLGTDRRTLSN